MIYVCTSILLNAYNYRALISYKNVYTQLCIVNVKKFMNFVHVSVRQIEKIGKDIYSNKSAWGH